MDEKVIKLRAWDKKRKVMFRVTTLDMDDSEIYPKRVEDGEPLRYIRRDDVELMQYIGRKDKNEVEIFEKDIVKTSDNEWGYGGKYDEDNDGYLYSVVPRIDEIVSGEVESIFDNFFGEWWLNAEVIGNVYENTNLKGKEYTQ